eukprot:12457200-Alexandrium_andersonii.AAC.1
MHHRGVVQREVRSPWSEEPKDRPQELGAIAGLHRPCALDPVELAVLAQVAVGKVVLGLRGCRA